MSITPLANFKARFFERGIGDITLHLDSVGDRRTDVEAIWIP
jgi:hypothetical protein